jgi:C4-dicarboxylate transporter DctQ subunit
VNFIKRIDRAMTIVEQTIVAICLALVTAIVFYGVINRFILKSSLSWSEELSRYLTIWATYVGASLGVRQGAHIGVEAFVDLLPKKARSYTNLLTYLASFVFVVFITITGIDYSLKLFTRQLSPAMRIPMGWPYLGVPVGTGLMAVRYLLLLIQEFMHVIGCGEVGDSGDHPVLDA